MHLSRYTLIGAWCFALTGMASAAATFSVTPDRTKIAVGETVQVTAILVSDRSLGNPAAPALPVSPDFRVLSSNQDQRTSSSVQIINGKTTRSSKHTYVFTYVIAPQKTGSFTFPALTLNAAGTTVTSQAFVVEVGETAVANPDMRMFVRVSKKTVYVGEQVLLTVTVAQKPSAQVRLSYEGFADLSRSVMDAVKGTFSVIDLTGGRPEQTQDRIDGELYAQFKIRFALFALKSGKTSIPSLLFTYGRLQQARRGYSDPFESFFGGGFFGNRVQVQPATVTGNAVSLNIKQLPAAPSEFSGAVGTCKFRGEISPAEVAAGDAVTLKLSVSGKTRPGNLADPVMPPLQGFEVFDPEKHVFIDTTATGVTTRKTFKYLLIPRQEGAVEIPALRYTFFDPSSASFTGVSCGPFALKVTKGAGGTPAQTRYLTQEDIRQVGQDIRYIRTVSSLKNQNARPYREGIFWGLYAIPFLLAIFSLLYKLQADRHSRDTGLSLQRQALARALRSCAHLTKNSATGSAADFAGSVAGIVATYVSARFRFPALGLTFDEMGTELAARGVDTERIEAVRRFFEKTDVLRFGGGVTDAAREALVNVARELVRELDTFRVKAYRSTGRSA